MTNTLLLGYDVNPDTGNTVLIVGKKRPNESVDIINAFEGDEAREIYKKLITKKEVK